MRRYGWQKRVTHDDDQKNTSDRARRESRRESDPSALDNEPVQFREDQLENGEQHEDYELCGTKKEKS